MRRTIGLTAGGLIAILVLGGWLWYAARLGQPRNLHTVREGVLYRSAQLSLGALRAVLATHRIKTVVTLRGPRLPGDPPPDLDEEVYCRTHGIRYYRLPPAAWWSSDGSVPARGNVDRFCAILADPANHPVLVHCCAGKHRTGACCAIYRMEFEGWTSDEAIAEMARHGYTNIEDHQDLYGFLRRYRPARSPAGGGPARPL